MAGREYQISVVVPVYNEGAGLKKFHESLTYVLQQVAKNSYEIIYCDDGSSDGTVDVVRKLAEVSDHVRLIKFSRNFGKESALTAGIAEARGQAIITLDGDGQHPVELIPQFIEAWKNGTQVVVGVRTDNTGEGFMKRYGSRWFYKAFNKVTGQKLVPGSSDFRLISREVQEAFLSLKETDRVTRGLIDWLGFRREYIPFKAKARAAGAASYNFNKLTKLAANSFVSLTPRPLYLFGYLGIFITLAAFVLGLAVIIEQLLLNDPWHWAFTGTAMLGIMLLFLVGIVLMSQGILALYISHIHSQAKGRPLYVIDRAGSIKIQEKKHDA